MARLISTSATATKRTVSCLIVSGTSCVLAILPKPIWAIFILSLGEIPLKTEEGIIAPHRLAVLERLITQPKVNNLLLWPGDDISVVDISPDSEI